MQPILFYLPFGLPLYGYGAMLFLSVVIGRLLALYLAERDGLDVKIVNRSCVWALAGAFVGARLLYVVTNLDQFDHVIEIFQPWKGGVVVYGGFLGGFVATVAFWRMHRFPFLAWVDCVAPSLCLGLIVTRVGCLLAGCDFGTPWNGPWAIQFPAGSPAFQQHATQGLLPLAATQSLAVHPTQIYESLAGLALLMLVMTVRARRSAPGQAFVAFVLGYAVLRSVIEVFRADLDRGAIGPLSTSQFIALMTCLLVLVLAYVRRGRGRVPLLKPDLTA